MIGIVLGSLAFAYGLMGLHVGGGIVAGGFSALGLGAALYGAAELTASLVVKKLNEDGNR